MTDWRGRTALVTGSSGFVGCWLSSHLRQNGAHVIAFSRRKTESRHSIDENASNGRLTHIEGSLADRSLLLQIMQDFKVDTVFHLAGQAKINVGHKSPLPTFESNIQGTWNVLDCALNSDKKIKVLVASTEVVYADSDHQPYTETSSVGACSPYAASKLCAEVLARCYHLSYGLPVCVVRTGNLYGGGDTSLERIIPGTICAILRGEAPIIKSDGLAERDYLYVEDAISGYTMLAAAMSDQQISGEIFNFTSGKPVSVLTIVEMILNLMGETGLTVKVLGQQSSGAAVRHASSAKAAQKLGWHAETSLESGLKKAIAWYQANASESLKEAAN